MLSPGKQAGEIEVVAKQVIAQASLVYQAP